MKFSEKLIHQLGIFLPKHPGLVPRGLPLHGAPRKPLRTQCERGLAPIAVRGQEGKQRSSEGGRAKCDLEDFILAQKHRQEKTMKSRIRNMSCGPQTHLLYLLEWSVHTRVGLSPTTCTPRRLVWTQADEGSAEMSQ